jgi:hypothetical protein
MMKKKKITEKNRRCLSHAIFIGLIMGALAACSSVDEKIYPQPEGIQTMTFTVRTPFAAPQTYAMTDVAENDIQTMDVLAFRIDNVTAKETFAYRAEGFDISNKGVSPFLEKEFKVTVQINDTVAHRFVFLANVKSVLDAASLVTGTERAPMLAHLLSSTAGAWDVTSVYTPFPMWGQSGPVYISETTTNLNNITLLRSIVSIEVDASAVSPSFTLQSVFLYNRKTAGCLAPADANYNATTKVVTAPTLPTSSYNVLAGLPFTVTAGSQKLEKTVYTYEAAAVANGSDADATCLVVGGTYIPDGTVCYYRLDFEVKDGGGLFQQYRPLLRNHRYRFMINNVTDGGYSTPDNAFYGKKGQLGAEILAWNLSDMENVVVNETFLLGLSSSSMTASSGIYYVGVWTNHPDGWTAARENPADTWIDAIDDSHDDFLAFNLTSNVPGRTGFIRVKAGNLTKRFKIVQQ